MPDKITWTNEKRKLRDLIPWPINPAQIGKDEAKRLEESLDEFGQVQTIAISPTNEIYDGHQRQTVWGASKKFGMDYEVDIRVSSRELTEDERKKLVIFLRKGTVGSFDFDLLANNWNTEDLLQWGFTKEELGIEDEFYTGKITSPQYEPQGDKPDIKTLINPDKATKLIADIDAAEGITDEEKSFLRIAAYRHIVFDFKKIANYYACSGLSMQHLMEENALVLIDFEDAIRLGYVHLTEEISNMRQEDYGVER